MSSRSLERDMEQLARENEEFVSENTRYTAQIYVFTRKTKTYANEEKKCPRCSRNANVVFKHLTTIY